MWVEPLRTQTNAIISLAVLEAVRDADVLTEGVPDMLAEALGTARFGGSATVAVQIKRYARLVKRGTPVGVEETAGLLRLFARRADADLVFADAGRRAGRYAAQRAPRATRLVHRITPGAIKRAWGTRLARRLAQDVFDVDIRADGRCVWRDGAGLGPQTTNGKACAIYGAATAELLRQFTMFDGALLHSGCRIAGEPTCEWSYRPIREG